MMNGSGAHEFSNIEQRLHRLEAHRSKRVRAIWVEEAMRLFDLTFLSFALVCYVVCWAVLRIIS